MAYYDILWQYIVAHWGTLWHTGAKSICPVIVRGLLAGTPACYMELQKSVHVVDRTMSPVEQ